MLDNQHMPKNHLCITIINIIMVMQIEATSYNNNITIDNHSLVTDTFCESSIEM